MTNWVQILSSVKVTPEQIVMGRQAIADHAAAQERGDAVPVLAFLYLRKQWPEWDNATSAAIMIRVRALDDIRAAERLDGMDLLDGAVMTAAAEAPIRIVDKAGWELDWPRFVAIAHDANRSEMQGLGLTPMDEIAEEPPEAANDDDSRHAGAPDPLVPIEADLGGITAPREAFAQAAVQLFGIDIETARQWANQADDRFRKPRVTGPGASDEDPS